MASHRQCAGLHPPSLNMGRTPTAHAHSRSEYWTSRDGYVENVIRRYAGAEMLEVEHARKRGACLSTASVMEDSRHLPEWPCGYPVDLVVRLDSTDERVQSRTR